MEALFGSTTCAAKAPATDRVDGVAARREHLEPGRRRQRVPGRHRSAPRRGLPAAVDPPGVPRRHDEHRLPEGRDSLVVVRRLGLGRVPGGVGRDDQAGRGEPRIGRVGRLLGPDVPERAGEAAVGQAREHRVEVDERGAGQVDEDRVRAEAVELRRPEHRGHARRARHVEGDRVGPAEQLVQAHELGAGRLLDVGVVREHAHAERGRLAGQRAPDAAVADDPEAGRVDPAQQARRRVVPAARAYRGIERHQAAQARQHARERVVGHLVRAVGRGVAHGDPARREAVHVDVVGPDAARDDGPQRRVALRVVDADRHDAGDDGDHLGSLVRLGGPAQPRVELVLERRGDGGVVEALIDVEDDRAARAPPAADHARVSGNVEAPA